MMRTPIYATLAIIAFVLIVVVATAVGVHCGFPRIGMVIGGVIGFVVVMIFPTGRNEDA